MRRLMGKMNLQVLIALCVSAFSLLACAVVGTLAYLQAEGELRVAVEDKLRNTAEAQAATLTTNAARWEAGIESLALSASTTSFLDEILLSDSPKEAVKVKEEYASDDFRKKPIADRAAYIGDEDKSLFSWKHAEYHGVFLNTWRDLNLSDIILFPGRSLSIYTVTKSGDFYKTGEEANFGALEDMRVETMKSETPLKLVSGFTDYPALGETSIFFTHPIYMGQETDAGLPPIGVAAFRVSLDKIKDTLVAGKKDQADIALVLLDKDRQVLVSTDPEKYDASAFAAPDLFAAASASGGYEGTLQTAGGGGVSIFAAEKITFGDSDAYLVVLQSEASALAGIYQMRWTMLAISVTAALLLGFLGVVVARMMAKPIREMTLSIKRLSEGDVSEPDSSYSDITEIRQMAEAIDILRQNEIARHSLAAEKQADDHEKSERQRTVQQEIRAFQEQASTLFSDVDTTARNLSETARTLDEAAQQGAEKAKQTQSASEAASENVQSVASAAEEMSASVAEINRQLDDTKSVLKRVSEQSTLTNDKIAGLVHSVSEVGKVITLIQDIAEQTNLLALNATIEAARAGEAGRGFAVVAAEVKELSTQTSNATTQIADQISAIQSSTNESVEAINLITGLIEEVDSSATAMAGAVSEQGIATTEISQNAGCAASEATSVRTYMSELSETVELTSSSSKTVRTASAEVLEKTTEFENRIQQFLHKIAS